MKFQTAPTVSKNPRKFHCKSNDSTQLSIELLIKKPELWSPGSPSLYSARATLRKNEVVIDNISDRIGIRKLSIEGNSILLNGNPVTIQGVNRYDEYGNLGVNAS